MVTIKLAFQSPSLRGSGRFEGNAKVDGCVVCFVSIPFIAGQWSLLRLSLAWGSRVSVFQSPSLRGSGRFVERRHLSDRPSI